jgi:biopolymer transport protein ExbD
LQFFIDKKLVDETNLEQELLTALGTQENKAIVLRAEEGVPIEKAVSVLDLANRNQIKVVLAVRPK